MLYNTSAGNLNATYIGQEYTLVSGDIISDMMKAVYNIPNTRASESAGWYRAFFELQKLGGYIPSGRNENVIRAGEKIKFFTKQEIDNRRVMPATQSAIVTYVPNAPIVETPIAAATPTEMGINKSKLFFIGGAAIGIWWLMFGDKKKGKKK